jgi:outer membrane protein OmpA-like peptidoglycan-associated protein
MRRWSLTGALLAFALSACAETLPRDVVILLDSPDGEAGAVEVTTSSGSSVLDQSGQAVALSGKQDVTVAPDEAVRGAFGDALAAEPEVPENFNLNFEFDTVVLTEESKATIPDIVAAVGRREVVDVSVVGHTDRAGDDVYNNRLSSGRAIAVRDSLVERGVDPTTIEVVFHGENNPLIETDDGVLERRNRRVEVTVR